MKKYGIQKASLFVLDSITVGFNFGFSSQAKKIFSIVVYSILTSFMYRKDPEATCWFSLKKKPGPFPIFNVGEGPSCMSFWRLLIATYMKQVAMYATAYYVKPQAALYSLGASLCLEIFAFFHLLFCRFYFSKLFLEWKIKSKLIEWYVNYVKFFLFFFQWFRAISAYDIHCICGFRHMTWS